jgi:HlyD family secretion protein
MKTASNAVWRTVLGCLAATLLLGIVAGCSRENPDRVQGYVEAEYVYVTAPLGGALETLYVQRSMQVQAGEPLFAQDNRPEKAARDDAQRKLAQGRANWEDLKKGKRPPEIESIEAQLKQARASLVLSESIYNRMQKLIESGAGSPEDFDRARSSLNQDRQRVAQLEADLQTAKLPARSDQIAAAEANVRALEAELARAEWDLAQKSQAAPKDGVIVDYLYREGEWISAGKPVIILLPPQNIKVRAFVSQTRVGSIHYGDRAQVFVDGVSQPFVGKVTFISPQAEYTPPVIYSRESRSKLVFMIEMSFDPKVAEPLHPGQPVDVQFGAVP